MSIAMRILRWRASQRRNVWRSLWMYGPFTAVQARQLCRKIDYSPVKAARLIRAYEQDQRRIEAERLLSDIRRAHGQVTPGILNAYMGVKSEEQLVREKSAAEIRSWRMEMSRARYQDLAAA